MSDAMLSVELQNKCLTVTINRPEKRNALNLALLDSIKDAFAEHRHADINVAVLTSVGDKAFAAGGDLQELDSLRSSAQARSMSEQVHTVLDEIRYFPVPVIGALNGVALGGGAELALACDLRIAAAHAELGLIQAQLAVTTAWGGGIDLIDAVGNSTALAILTAGKRLSAAEALALRLYADVCPEGEDFGAFTREFAGRYTIMSGNVLRVYKATSAARRRQLHDELSDIARTGFVETWIHEDHWTAAAAALKKR
ncbi:MAG: enoyl-CoA hydratase/isomerase family protein [Gammaproteobacteria bacterium]|jgi:enoyl-CoA hydratase/carnithine racemase|nr:enoyl-CoA hydratase/isomerase family protein [Gammaproteobacteria bacterium]